MNEPYAGQPRPRVQGEPEIKEPDGLQARRTGPPVPSYLTRTALHLIGHGEDMLAAGNEHPVPEWFDWFSAPRLAAFKGNTQLRAGHLPQARATLSAALDQLPEAEEKQRSVVLGDLAAVEAAAGDVDAACQYAVRALDQLKRTWYATGMDRVRDVRQALVAHQHEQCVRDLDERLYDWSTTVSALAR